MKKIGSLIVKTAVFLVLLSLCTGLLMPKYVESLEEGSFIAEYYREDVPHDILFVGDCESYGNFSPAELWRSFGISSYIRGSAQQLVPQSYYLLEEMLGKETPKLVVMNVLAMSEPVQTNEAYNRMTMDGMKLSSSKIGAIKATMTEEETLASYIFPLLRFHSRWSELGAEDIEYLFSKPLVSHSGYLMEAGVKPAQNIPKGKPLGDYSFSKQNLEYLEKMIELCGEKGCEIILVKAPSLYPYWYPQWDAQIADIAARYGVEYINMIELADEIGLDYEQDTYDGGLHLNVYGAEKLSRWFGSYVKDRYGLGSHAGEASYESVWAEKLARYDEDREARIKAAKEKQ